MLVDLEELKVELFEQGLDLEINLDENLFLVSLTNKKDGQVLAVIKDTTEEKAIAKIIRKLADFKLEKIGGLSYL